MSAAALVATAFAMGLAGAAHCTTMCGGPCMALTGASSVAARGCADDGHDGGVGGGAGIRRAGQDAAVIVLARVAAPALPTALLAFLAARLASYAVFGALVASSVAGLAWLGEQVAALRPFWVLLHVGVMVLGITLLLRGRQPGWLVEASHRLGGLARSASTAAGRPAGAGHPAGGNPVRRAAVAGLAWGALPCGLLQSALVVAALASTAVEGAAVMAAFALASSLGLVAAPALWRLLRRIGPQGEVWVTRLAGLLLASASTVALWMFSTAGLQAAVCVV
jgi:uncharacterized protein